MRDELLDKVAWVGHRHITGRIRGIVVRFQGLGAQGMKASGDALDLELAQHGALLVEPFHEPWAWMNDRTRDFYDEVVDAVRSRHQLPTDLPLISTGNSMGGHGALAYAFRSRHRVTACQANCPVGDLPFHYTERPDLPRTFHHAYGSYGDINAALELRSPLHQAAQMPDIPYQIIHGQRDKAVNKERHSDRLVVAMRAQGRRIEYLEAPEMEHCGPFTWPLWRRWADFIPEQLAAN